MIRSYQPEDKDQLIALFDLNSPNFFDPSEEKDFIEYLEREVEDYFVLEEDGQVMGCGGLNYFNDKKTIRISWDMVHPAFQNKGLGSQLVQYRLAYVKQQEAAELLVVRTSQFAHKFYARFGFNLVQTSKDYWAEGFDLYQMEMALK